MTIDDILLTAPLQALDNLTLPAFGTSQGVEELLHHLELVTRGADLRLEKRVVLHKRMEEWGGVSAGGEGGEEEGCAEVGLGQNGEAIRRIREELINCLHGKLKLIKEF